jgi:hypothetical protein
MSSREAGRKTSSTASRWTGDLAQTLGKEGGSLLYPRDGRMMGWVSLVANACQHAAIERVHAQAQTTQRSWAAAAASRGGNAGSFVHTSLARVS